MIGKSKCRHKFQHLIISNSIEVGHLQALTTACRYRGTSSHWDVVIKSIVCSFVLLLLSVECEYLPALAGNTFMGCLENAQWKFILDSHIAR